MLRRLALLALPLSLAAASCGEDPPAVSDAPPVAVAYDEACAETYADRRVTVEGVLHLFPRMLSCYPGGNSPRGRSCQIKLLPDQNAPTGSVEIERAYYTVFLDEGKGPGWLDPAGYGLGLAPLPAKVLDADSVRVDPYDRVRVTGTLRVRDLFERDRGPDGKPIGCSLTEVSRVEIAEQAVYSWADEQQVRRDSIQARIDSLRAVTDALREAREAREAAR